MMGINGQTCYRRKKKYGGWGISELRYPKQQKKINRRQKKLVAGLSLDNAMIIGISENEDS